MSGQSWKCRGLLQGDRAEWQMVNDGFVTSDSGAF